MFRSNYFCKLNFKNKKDDGKIHTNSFVKCCFLQQVLRKFAFALGLCRFNVGINTLMFSTQLRFPTSQLWLSTYLTYLSFVCLYHLLSSLIALFLCSSHFLSSLTYGALSSSEFTDDSFAALSVQTTAWLPIIRTNGSSRTLSFSELSHLWGSLIFWALSFFVLLSFFASPLTYGALSFAEFTDDSFAALSVQTTALPIIRTNGSFRTLSFSELSNFLSSLTYGALSFSGLSHFLCSSHFLRPLSPIGLSHFLCPSLIFWAL